MTRDEAALRLAVVSSELREQYFALGSEEMAALDAKFTRWQQGTSDTSITEYRMEIDFSAYESTREIAGIKARIAQLEEERDNLRFFIKYGMESHLG